MANYTINPEELDETVTIDIMLAYTDSTEAQIVRADNGFESIDTYLAQRMNEVQSMYENSETGIEFRLVHTHNVDFDEY